jgi:hypothetical protein
VHIEDLKESSSLCAMTGEDFNILSFIKPEAVFNWVSSLLVHKLRNSLLAGLRGTSFWGVTFGEVQQDISKVSAGTGDEVHSEVSTRSLELKAVKSPGEFDWAEVLLKEWVGKVSSTSNSGELVDSCALWFVVLEKESVRGDASMPMQSLSRNVFVAKVAGLGVILLEG